MLGVLKNVFLSACFVVVATVATASVATVACLFFKPTGLGAPDPSVAITSASAAIMAGAVAGFLFCFISLPVAALTMPPMIGFVRLLKLPRPLMDCIGGGLAALIVSAAVVGLFEQLARSKGGSAPGADMRLILDVCAMVGGVLLGYVRHNVLVRKRETPTEPQFAAA
jgi:hypothetical protein